MLKELGKTGIQVSRIGLGTVKFGRNTQVKYPTHFELPDDQTILNLLSVAEELGINLLDTAPAYGVSEERIGKLLKENRKKWVISTKFGEEFVNGQSHFDFSKKAAKKSIERSLQRLNTDYLDIVLAHSDGQDEKIINEYEVFDTLDSFKKSGLIRAFGMSTKTIEGGKQTILQSDIAMVTLNPNETDQLPVIHLAHQLKKGIFIKKALASGHLQKLGKENGVKNAMELIFKEHGVSSVILGTIDVEHLKYNVQCVSDLEK